MVPFFENTLCLKLISYTERNSKCIVETAENKYYRREKSAKNVDFIVITETNFVLTAEKKFYPGKRCA